jgi:succinate dehydrogenase (ubiquinone) membrane anchor subunit
MLPNKLKFFRWAHVLLTPLLLYKLTLMLHFEEVIDGTVNDPVPVPESHKAHGSYHWTFERALSVALIPLIVTPFVTGTSTPVLDALIGTSVVLHSHIGFSAMITDYIPKHHYPKSRTVFTWGLRAATVVVLIGVYEFEVNEVGMSL